MSRQGSGAEQGRQADQQNLAQRPQPWDKGSLGRKPPCRLPVTKWSSDCPSRHWQGPATRGSSGQQLLFNYLVLTQNTGSQTGSGERIIYSFVEPSSHSRDAHFEPTQWASPGRVLGTQRQRGQSPLERRGGPQLFTETDVQTDQNPRAKISKWLFPWHTSLLEGRASIPLAGMSRFC